MVQATKRTPKSTRLSRKMTPAGAPAATLAEVPLAKLVPPKFNAREEAAAEIESLVPSVRDHGLLAPIVVHPASGGHFEIVAGERRYRAALAAKKTTVPVLIHAGMDDAQAVVAGVIENVARRNLNPIERGRAIAKLVAPIREGGGGLNMRAAAKLFGVAANHLARYVKLLQLPERWRTPIASGEVSWRSARVLLQWIDQPDVLAAIDADRLANPWSYGSTQGFEASARRVAAGQIKAPTAGAIAKPKPPRAAPNKIAAAAKRSFGTDALDADALDAEPLDARDGAADEAARDAAYTLRVAVDLIGQLATIEQIEQVEAALAARRAELTKAARGK